MSHSYKSINKAVLPDLRLNQHQQNVNGNGGPGLENQVNHANDDHDESINSDDDRSDGSDSSHRELLQRQRRERNLFDNFEERLESDDDAIIDDEIRMDDDDDNGLLPLTCYDHDDVENENDFSGSDNDGVNDSGDIDGLTSGYNPNTNVITAVQGEGQNLWRNQYYPEDELSSSSSTTSFVNLNNLQPSRTENLLNATVTSSSSSTTNFANLSALGTTTSYTLSTHRSCYSSVTGYNTDTAREGSHFMDAAAATFMAGGMTGGGDVPDLTGAAGGIFSPGADGTGGGGSGAVQTQEASSGSAGPSLEAAPKVAPTEITTQDDTNTVVTNQSEMDKLKQLEEEQEASAGASVSGGANDPFLEKFKDDFIERGIVDPMAIRGDNKVGKPVPITKDENFWKHLDGKKKIDLKQRKFPMVTAMTISILIFCFYLNALKHPEVCGGMNTFLAK